MNTNNIYSPPNADLVSATDAFEETGLDKNLASRWARLGAYSIDSIIMILPFVAVFYLTDYWELTSNNEISIAEQLLVLLLGFAQYLILHGYLLHKRGQTIGKWALGIKIVSIKTNKIIPLWKAFFVRYLPPVIVAMIPLIGIILALANDLFIFRKDKRCIHDHLAGTKVIKEYAH